MAEQEMSKEDKLARLYKIQNVRYINLTNQIGEDMARYCMCAAYNHAYDPDIDCVSFEDYVGQIKGKKFSEGIVRLQEDLEVSEEQRRKWLADWGIGDKSKPYTQEDYEKLDETFKTYASRLEKSGGMDALQEDTLRSCSKMRLQADKAVVKGDKDSVAVAKNLNQMIQEQLASEQLRKRDEKPIGIAKLDGIVDALAKKYGAGSELTYEQATEICSKWLASHRYPYTMDAAEHMMLAMMNNIRQNNDLPMMAELPKEAQIPDELASEFAEKPNQAEKEAYEYLNLTHKRKPTLF